MEKVEVRGYVDPRTGEYVRATEAGKEEATEALGFIMAWKFYWDGPMTEMFSDERDVGPHFSPLYDRETWLNSRERRAWLDSLTEEQRQALADVPPPEEVPELRGDAS